MKHADGSNSVSTPRAPQQTEKILELPKSALKTQGDKLFIFYRRKLHRVGKTREGLYRGKRHDIKWLVRLV